METYNTIILIVAKALPGLNTHFYFSIYNQELIGIFLFMIGGGILIVWYLFKYYLSFYPITTNPKNENKSFGKISRKGEIALPAKHSKNKLKFNNHHVPFNPIFVALARVRGYCSDNCNNNTAPIIENNNDNNNNSNLNKIDCPTQIENTAPPLIEEGVPSLDELLKFKEEIKKIRNTEFDALSEPSEGELKDWDIDELGFIYHSSSKESTSFEESFPNYNKDLSQGELENKLNPINGVNKILGNKRILELFKERFNSESLMPLRDQKQLQKQGSSFEDEIKNSKEILNTIINENDNNSTEFSFLKWNLKENNKLNIEVDLEKSKDIYNNTISMLKHLNLDTIDVSAKLIPLTGWMLAHRSFMNTFHKHLNKNQANKSHQEILRFKKINFRNLALVHVLSLFCTGIITIGFAHTIKNNTTFPISLPSEKFPLPLPREGDLGIDSIPPKNEASKDSNIVKSLLPIFIINKFNKLSKFLRKCGGITISFIIYIILYILTNYFPKILEYINYLYNYKTFGYLSIFLMFYIIYTLFELIITYYFVQYKDSSPSISAGMDRFLENKIYKILPNYIKKDIISFREYDSNEDKEFFKKQYFVYILIHLISLIISFLIIIFCLIIF